MDTREHVRIAREVRLKKWTGILCARQESGQTIRGYCQTNGINEKSYYYWQRQLRAVACEGLGTREEKAPSGWAIYKPAMASTNVSGLTAEIGGYQIRIDESVEPELLARTCRVLKSIC
jgi:putative transposase